MNAKKVKKFGKSLKGYADAFEVAIGGYHDVCEEIRTLS